MTSRTEYINISTYILFVCSAECFSSIFLCVLVQNNLSHLWIISVHMLSGSVGVIMASRGVFGVTPVRVYQTRSERATKVAQAVCVCSHMCVLAKRVCACVFGFDKLLCLTLGLTLECMCVSGLHMAEVLVKKKGRSGSILYEESHFFCFALSPSVDFHADRILHSQALMLWSIQMVICPGGGQILTQTWFVRE